MKVVEGDGGRGAGGGAEKRATTRTCRRWSRDRRTMFAGRRGAARDGGLRTPATAPAWVKRSVDYLREEGACSARATSPKKLSDDLPVELRRACSGVLPGGRRRDSCSPAAWRAAAAPAGPGDHRRQGFSRQVNVAELTENRGQQGTQEPESRGAGSSRARYTTIIEPRPVARALALDDDGARSTPIGGSGGRIRRPRRRPSTSAGIGRPFVAGRRHPRRSGQKLFSDSFTLKSGRRQPDPPSDADHETTASPPGR